MCYICKQKQHVLDVYKDKHIVLHKQK